MSEPARSVDHAFALLIESCTRILRLGITHPLTQDGRALVNYSIDQCLTSFDLLANAHPTLRARAPRHLLRRWAWASLWKAAHLFRKARRALYRERYEDFHHYAHQGALWAYQAYDLFTIRRVISTILSDLAPGRESSHHLTKGDVVLSYKSREFLKHELLSRIIAFSTNSPITHSLIVVSEDPAHALLSANPESNGLGLSGAEPRPGELYLIFEVRTGLLPFPKDTLVRSLDEWVDHAKTSRKRYYSFAELESWSACLIGSFYVLSSYLWLKPVCFSNPFRTNKKIFCSELIDSIFKKVGVYLTPRSFKDSVVGPVELLLSPYLAFKGIIVHPDDREQFRKEVSDHFILEMGYRHL